MRSAKGPQAIPPSDNDQERDTPLPPETGSGSNDDPPPTLTLSAAVEKEFLAVLHLYKKHYYLSDSEWREWELWRERNAR